MKMSSPERFTASGNMPPNPFISKEPRPKTPEEIAEIARKTEALLDALLQEFIENNARKINEGNNGVIFKVDFRGANELVRKRLEQNGLHFNEEQAVKILKFGKSEGARDEFEMQRRFYQIIESADKNGKPMAKIPRPVACRSIKVDAILRDKLVAQGVQYPGEEIDVMVMDLVEGEDMATLMYRAILEKHPKTVHLRNDLQYLSFDQLSYEVSQALGFVKPGGKGRTEIERVQEKTKIDAENARKVYTELRRTGFQLHPSIEPQMRNALNEIHRHNLIHRDAHHRNFMIEGDIRAEAIQLPQVYLIDFGTAKDFSGEYSERLFTESAGDGVGFKFVEDFMVPNDIRANFMQSEAEQGKAEFAKELHDIKTTFDKLQKNPTKKSWTASLDIPDPKRNYLLIYAQAPQPKLKAFIGLLHHALEKGSISTTEVEKVLQAQAKFLPLPEQALITRFLSTLESR